MTDPLDNDSLSMARQVLKRPIQPVVVSNTDLDLALEKIFGENTSSKRLRTNPARAG